MGAVAALLRAYSAQLSGKYSSVEECLLRSQPVRGGVGELLELVMTKASLESTDAFEGWNKN